MGCERLRKGLAFSRLDGASRSVVVDEGGLVDSGLVDSVIGVFSGEGMRWTLCKASFNWWSEN